MTTPRREPPGAGAGRSGSAAANDHPRAPVTGPGSPPCGALTDFTRPWRTTGGGTGGIDRRRGVMSEESVVPGGSAGQPRGLLQQMEELMATLDADLSALDADLQSPGRDTEERDAG